MYHPLFNPRRIQIKDPNFAFDLSTFKRDLKSSQMKSLVVGICNNILLNKVNLQADIILV